MRDGGKLDPYRIAEEWGIERTMWAREWSTLSGGEGQRVALAIAIGLGGAEVVLLDGESFSTSQTGTRRGSKCGNGLGVVVILVGNGVDLVSSPRVALARLGHFKEMDR